MKNSLSKKEIANLMLDDKTSLFKWLQDLNGIEQLDSELVFMAWRSSDDTQSILEDKVEFLEQLQKNNLVTED